MNILDLFFLACLLFFSLSGLAKGLIRQVGSLIGFVAALVFGGLFADDVALLIRNGFEQWPAFADPLSYLAGYVIVFFITSLVFDILVKLVDRFFNIIAIFPFLKTANRLAGAFFGLLEGVLFSALIVFLLHTIPLGDMVRDKVDTSVGAPYFLAVSYMIKPLLPAPAEFTIPTIQELEKYTPEAIEMGSELIQ